MGLHFSKQHLIKLGIFSIAVFSFFPLFLSLYVIGVLTIAFYFSVFTMSWDLLFGYSGEVNFGPTFLIGIGAYTAALLNINTSLPVVACIIFGTIAAVVAGILLVAPALRLRGPYFGLVTLVSVLLLEEVLTVFAQYTGGEIGISLGGVLSLSSITNYYYALILVVITALILIFITSSPFGLILQASAQDPIEAASLGFNIVKYKILAFVLSCVFLRFVRSIVSFLFGYCICKYRCFYCGWFANYHSCNSRRQAYNCRTHIRRFVYCFNKRMVAIFGAIRLCSCFNFSFDCNDTYTGWYCWYILK